MRWLQAFVTVLLISDQVGAQDFDAQVTQYTAQALRDNLALKSQTLEVEKALYTLAAARARFYPELALEARYTRAEGGREIAVPIGAALNPVYTTLNELLSAHGQSPRFGQISDQTVPFLREREQDTRLTLRQPVFAPGLSAAVRAQRALLDAANYRRMAVARAMRRDVTLAYVGWLQARNAAQIVAASELLLQENLRVNQSLFENGKITEDQVLRANAELLDVVQQKRQAGDGVTQAQSYLNFLLNRDLRTPLEAAEPRDPARRSTALEQLWTQALARRPEITEVEQLKDASSAQVRAAETQRWPVLSLGIDTGIQGEDYRFGEGAEFTTASLVFTWRIFDGGADRALTREARAAERQIALRQEEIAQQIRLEVQQAWDRLQSARDSLATAQARAQAARAAFRIASRKRDEGVISQVEFIDARSALTSAELNYSWTRFDVLAREAELDYATATGDLPLDMSGA